LDVTDVLQRLPPLKYPLPFSDPLVAALDNLRDEMERLADRATPIPVGDVQICSPVANPSKIIGTPANYPAHVEEARNDAEIAVYSGGRKRSTKEQGLFLKATSSLVGPGQGVAVRFADRRTDHEIELGVVIGQRTGRVSEADALKVVAGYNQGRQYRCQLRKYCCRSLLGRPYEACARDHQQTETAARQTKAVNGRFGKSLRQKGSLRQTLESFMEMTLHNALGLADRVCVITGAASGIGRAIAIAFAKEGARIAILDRNLAGAEETVAMIVGLGAQGMAVECDTTNPASVETARSAVVSKFGAADVLVNNAGIVLFSKLATVPLDDWNRVIAVNLTGYLICSQVFGARMRELRRGALVHIASMAAEQTMPDCGSYGVSKAGVTMLSRSLAVEWGPYGIRSNTVCPGYIQTPIAKAAWANPAVSKGRADASPLKRAGQPEDVAQAVLFLASPRASFVSGIEMLVDGAVSRSMMSLIPRP
jgi:NAD(P)-dependent dehydrogenase (short-subunit alcohol dehydrogenase family)